MTRRFAYAFCVIALTGCPKQEPTAAPDAVVTVPPASVVPVVSAIPSASATPPDAGASAKPIVTAYDVGTDHICIPDSWTQGKTVFSGPPRCGETPTKRIWDGDVHRPCGPCAFSFDSAMTSRERGTRSNACCFEGRSPGGP